jgi:5-methylcytosine-specific restriction endonuclease McrA
MWFKPDIVCGDIKYIYCHYCGEAIYSKHITKDHKIPVSKGGTDEASNIVPACRACNTDKGDSDYLEYITKRLKSGRLSMVARKAFEEIKKGA